MRERSSTPPRVTTHHTANPQLQVLRQFHSWPSDCKTDLRGAQFSYSTVQRGPVVGAGLDFKTHYVTISPELRFNHFTDGYPHENRVTALVGFTFGHKK